MALKKLKIEFLRNSWHLPKEVISWLFFYMFLKIGTSVFEQERSFLSSVINHFVRSLNSSKDKDLE